MASNYEGFFVNRISNDGVIEQLPGVDVRIWDVDGAADLGTVTTDVDGYIVAGSVTPAAGTKIRFRVEDEEGLAGSVTQITT